jgi:hypothetical protein
MCLISVSVGAATWLSFILPNPKAAKKLAMIELNDVETKKRMTVEDLRISKEDIE